MSSVYSDKLTMDFNPLLSKAGQHNLQSANFKLKGPPKTSRFYKSLPESKSDSTTTHHYNPYLYLQHRTRVNPPLDFNFVDMRENINENYQYNAVEETEVLINDEFSFPIVDEDFKPKELPTFFMSENEFKDPIEFTEKISHIGKKYGGVKVVPPASWLTSFSLNTELFWFRLRRQLLNNFKNEMESRLDFFYQLFEYHASINKKKNAQQILNKLPSIDKRILDLYRLRKYVKLRGGFHVVCKRKLWAQIGRELGYSGRIMTSLSSSLKSAYQRVILDFDEYQEKNGEILNTNGKRLFNGINSNPSKKKKTSNELFDDLPTILGSTVEFKRPRDILRSKGFHTYFNNITEEKRLITSKDAYTLSEYNFYDWFNQSLMNVLDTSSYDSKLAPLYNLKQFFEKNLKFEELILKKFASLIGIDPNLEYEHIPKNKTKNKGTERGAISRWPINAAVQKPDDESLERLFWNIIFNKNLSQEVESGAEITSTVHESAFPTISCPQPIGDDKIKESVDPWNLNNFAINENCMLRFLDDDDYSGIAIPKLNVGMMFSTENWNIEDHYLQKVSYNHLGSTRIWYSIPPAYQKKFEALVNKTTIQKRKLFKEDEEPKIVGANVSLREYLNCSMENRVEAFYDNDRYIHQNSTFFDKFFPDSHAKLTKFDRDNPNSQWRLKSRIEDAPVFYNQDTFFPPEYLIKNGIPVYKTYQHPGQFIIKFPKSYTSSVCLGFTVGESVNYATPNWLDSMLEAEKWLISQNIVPYFASNHLLINIAKGKLTAKDEKLKDKVRPLYLKFYKKEMDLRAKFKTLLPKIKPQKITELLVDYKDTFSDHTLESCFPSKIILVYNNTNFQASLENFLTTYETNKKFAKATSKLQIEYQVYYSDQDLQKIYSMLFASSNDVKEWLGKFHHFVNNDEKPQLEDLKTLLADSFLYETLTEYRNLKKFVCEAQLWIKNAQIILRSKNTRGQPFLNIRFVQGVIDVIPDLKFSCPEIQALLDLSSDIKRYNRAVEKFLDEPDHTLEQFNELIYEGEAFGIQLKSLGYLVEIVKCMNWKSKVGKILQDQQESEMTQLMSLLHESRDLIYDDEERELLDRLKIKIDQGDDLDAKIKQMFKNEKIQVEEIEDLLLDFEGVPLYPATKKMIENINTDHVNHEEDMRQCYAVLDGIQARVDTELKIQHKILADPLHVTLTSDEIQALKQFSISFDGGPNDARSKQFELLQLLANLKRYAIPGHERLQVVTDRAEEWKAECTKLMVQNNVLNFNESFKDMLLEICRTNGSCLGTYEIDPVRGPEDANTNYVEKRSRCFCRKTEEFARMISCENCLEKYHEPCLKKMSNYKKIFDDGFVCAVCDNFKSAERKYLRPKFRDVILMYFNGRTLLSCPDELFLLTDIVKQGSRFIKEMYLSLKVVERNDGEFLEVTKDDIYRLKFYLRKFEASPINFEFEVGVIRDKIEHLEKDRKVNTLSFGKSSILLN